MFVCHLSYPYLRCVPYRLDLPADLSFPLNLYLSLPHSPSANRNSRSHEATDLWHHAVDAEPRCRCHGVFDVTHVNGTVSRINYYGRSVDKAVMSWFCVPCGPLLLWVGICLSLSLSLPLSLSVFGFFLYKRQEDSNAPPSHPLTHATRACTHT